VVRVLDRVAALQPVLAQHRAVGHLQGGVEAAEWRLVYSTMASPARSKAARTSAICRVVVIASAADRSASADAPSAAALTAIARALSATPSSESALSARWMRTYGSTTAARSPAAAAGTSGAGAAVGALATVVDPLCRSM